MERKRGAQIQKIEKPHRACSRWRSYGTTTISICDRNTRARYLHVLPAGEPRIRDHACVRCINFEDGILPLLVLEMSSYLPRIHIVSLVLNDCGGSSCLRPSLEASSNVGFRV